MSASRFGATAERPFRVSTCLRSFGGLFAVVFAVVVA